MTRYERVDPVMPHRPVVPAGAPGELRLDVPYYLDDRKIRVSVARVR